MGPMKGEPWVRDSDSAASARIGFSALVYAVSFFFVWMILTFFALRMGRRHLCRRALAGLALSVVVMVAYAMWRDPQSCPLNLPR
jgi:C4-dicarboxylate transporter DctM subunit